MIFKPTEYAKEVFGNKISPATVRNWIKTDKLPKHHRVEKTPTGQYLIHIDEQPKTKAEELFRMMEKRVA